MPFMNISRSVIWSVRASRRRALMWVESTTLSRIAARYSAYRASLLYFLFTVR